MISLYLRVHLLYAYLNCSYVLLNWHLLYRYQSHTWREWEWNTNQALFVSTIW